MTGAPIPRPVSYTESYSSVMVSPVLEMAQFPPGTWYREADRGGMISKEAQMTPFSLVVTFLARANEAHAKGSLFLDEDELREMKLGDGNSSAAALEINGQSRSNGTASEVGVSFGDMRTVMVEISGLELPVGKDFAMRIGG
ncbi:hypothetical protein SAY86_002911 [Trapa natans]|uniref:Uncharacterized protein n=1 Tax=Trapa natans TaxID=22666 RepID=A0AAN7LGH0_TRANT|nr:hypothetical protein SAY86_002911 [Trapa natans]